MHLIIHRLYSTDALLATPSPVDQLSSRVSALRLGGCGFKPGHTKDSKNGTHCLLRVFGHGLGGLIKPFYSILKRPLWLPPNMAPKVHTQKKCFIRPQNFVSHGGTSSALGWCRPQCSSGPECPSIFLSTLLCLETILPWRSVWLHAWFVFSHTLSTVRPTTDNNKKKSVAPSFACIPGGHWDSDFCM